MEPIKTYTYQSERFNVVKEWTTKNTVFYVTSNDREGFEYVVSTSYGTEKEAMAFIVSRLERRINLITARLHLVFDIPKR